MQKVQVTLVSSLLHNVSTENGGKHWAWIAIRKENWKNQQTRWREKPSKTKFEKEKQSARLMIWKAYYIPYSTFILEKVFPPLKEERTSTAQPNTRHIPLLCYDVLWKSIYSKSLAWCTFTQMFYIEFHISFHFFNSIRWQWCFHTNDK